MEHKTFRTDLDTGSPTKNLTFRGSHAQLLGDPKIALPKPPCDTDTKDQNVDPPFRYVHEIEDKERINQCRALSVRTRVGAASGGREGGHRRFGGFGILVHGGFLVIISMSALAFQSATPDCARLRTVEGIASFLRCIS